jgi:hypothetical protein
MTENATGSRYQALLNAIPLWAFVMDDDLRVQDLNDAAAAEFASDKTVVLNRPGGEVLRCLHSLDSPQGCGHGPFCASCIIRNAVGESLRGEHVSRRRARVTLVSGGLKKEYELLVTANRMTWGAEPLALLVIEDVTEIAALRGIIPICATCKMIRDDQEYWKSVESYFREHEGAEFATGLCPVCLKAANSEAAGAQAARKE